MGVDPGEARGGERGTGESGADEQSPELLEFARGVLAAQPFSELLDARLAAFCAGRAVLELPIEERLHQQNGYLHGGVLSYAADNALTFAAGTVLGTHLLTVGFTIDYLRPAVGTLLRAEATVVDSARSRATCRCELFAVGEDGAARPCALAQGSVVVPSRSAPGRAEAVG